MVNEIIIFIYLYHYLYFLIIITAVELTHLIFVLLFIIKLINVNVLKLNFRLYFSVFFFLYIIEDSKRGKSEIQLINKPSYENVPFKYFKKLVYHLQRNITLVYSQ